MTIGCKRKGENASHERQTIRASAVDLPGVQGSGKLTLTAPCEILFMAGNNSRHAN